MDKTSFDDLRSAIIGVVIALNATLNVIVIAVLLRYPQLREDNTNIFILSLTLSDLAHGCTSMPVSVALCAKSTAIVRNVSGFLPKIHAICSIWFGMVSMQSLCWVTLYKMVAIKQPFRCALLLSRKRCNLLIAVSWSFGATASITISNWVNSWNLDTCMHGLPSTPTLPTGLTVVVSIILVFGIAVPMSLMVYATANIVLVIMRTHRQIAQQTSSIASLYGRNEPSLTSRAIRSGKNVLIMGFTDVVLKIPMIVYMTGILLGKESAMPPSFKFLAVWIILCNTFANSFLYLVIFKSIRRKTFTMFKECAKLIGIR